MPTFGVFELNAPVLAVIAVAAWIPFVIRVLSDRKLNKLVMGLTDAVGTTSILILVITLITSMDANQLINLVLTITMLRILKVLYDWKYGSSRGSDNINVTREQSHP